MWLPRRPQRETGADSTSPRGTLPAELWGMVCDRLATRFDSDWPYEMRDNDEDPCVEPEEAWLSSRSALCSLARTCRYLHAMVEPQLYDTVRLTSGRSALLLWDSLCRAPRLQRCIRSLDATGPIDEQACRTAVERFAGDSNRRGTCEGLDAVSARLHKDPVALCDAAHLKLCRFMNEPLASFHEKNPACEDCILPGPRPECTLCDEMRRPLLATTIVASIPGCLPALCAVRINAHFIPHSGAYEMLKQAVDHLARKAQCRSYPPWW